MTAEQDPENLEPLTEKEKKESRSIIAVIFGLLVIAVSFFWHILSPLFSDPKP